MFGAYRLLLACLVALSHFGLTIAGFNPGQWSVLSFYVLSGFLMELQYRKLARPGAFYLDRFLRVYPLFAVVLIFAATLARPTAWTLLVNFALVPLDYAVLTKIPILVYPSWSLACEMHFYALVPLLSQWSTKTLRGMAVAGLAFLSLTPFLPHPDFWGYNSIAGVLFAFLSGMLIARKDVFFLRVLWGFAFVLLALFALSKVRHWGLPTGFHINICIGYLIALPVVTRLSGLSPKVKWDQTLGLLSYPLFLVHEPVRDLIWHLTGTLPHMAVLLLCSIAAAAVLVVAVERPFDKIRYKLRRRPQGGETVARAAVSR